LIQAIEKKFGIVKVKYLYRRDNGSVIVTKELSDIREGYQYNVCTVNDAMPTDLEGFYAFLVGSEQLNSAEIDMVRQGFAAEGVRFNQLFETGDLALDDDTLLACGIRGVGLRRAVLDQELES
jgi:hypothetical protein